MLKKITLFIFLLLATTCFSQSPNFNYTQTCYGQQTIFVGTSALADTAIQMMQWDVNGDGIYDFTGDSIVHFFTTTGTFAVKLKVTPHFGSPDSITKNVTINPLPNVNFIVNNLCTGSLATYYNTTTISSGSIAQFMWDFDNNGTTDNNTNDTATFNCGGSAHTYYSKLTCISDKGCSAFAVKTMQVYATPVASFSVMDTCLKDNTVFTNSTTITSPDFYLWNFGDGTQTSTSGDANHVYAFSGTYNVSLIAVSLQGCRDTSAAMAVNINSLPMVTIRARNNDTTFFDGGSATLGASGANTYLWSTSATTDSITVTQTGSYSVVGTNTKGCVSSAFIDIIKETIPDSVSVSSNILTPNGDGINDMLMINNVAAYQSCKVSVYNMWNVLIYSKDGYDNTNGWDGTYSGKVVPDGAYYYIITCDDKPVLTGNINVLTKK